MTFDMLPDRPLTDAEVAALTEVEGVEAVEPIVRVSSSPSIIAFIVVREDVYLSFGWKASGPEGWKIVNREPRE